MTDPIRDAPIRLLLVDDHAVMRAGLANMLDSRPEFCVVGGADDGDSALELFRTHRPDVTVLDVVMPGMGGLECLQRLREIDPESPVMMLSSSELEQDMHRALELGANGYVTKNARPSELVESIIAVGRGERFVSAEVARRMKDYVSISKLTPRELEVLNLLRKGMSNPDIGSALEITARTAKAHVAAIMTKLKAQDRAEAVAKGFEKGLLRP